MSFTHDLCPLTQIQEDETLLMIAAKSGLAPTSDIVVELINAAVNAANGIEQILLAHKTVPLCISGMRW